MSDDRLQLAMAQSVVPLLLEMLNRLVKRDLPELDVVFDWPEGQTIKHRPTLLVSTGRRLNHDERKKLDAWMQKNLGAHFPAGTIWDRVLDDDVV